MKDNIAIEVERVSKVYKLYNKPIDRLKESLSLTRKQYHENYYALNYISFKVRKGETVGIIGANGAGKSTLLKILTGVITPTSGNLIVNGKVSALLELGAGFNPEYTGLENIYLNGAMMGYDRKGMDDRVQSIIDFADIGEFIYQPVKNYSSGMFARLAFAVAINVEPDILIVDEALSVGDTRFQMKCIEKMKNLMEMGTTVLFVSHDINVIRRFCTVGMWLNRGKIEVIGNVNEVADSYIDYLKRLTETNNIDNSVESSTFSLSQKPFIPNEGIADIIDLKIFDDYNQETSIIGIEQPIKVQVIYDVYDENVQKPVMGVAIFGADNEYLCGVNTLLDKKSIPWKYGRNAMNIYYNTGIRVIGGTYTFTAALFDETATVAIDFRSKLKEFVVRDKYIGEGKFIVPHRWEKLSE